MLFEINKLIESDIDQIRDIAWLLYDKEGKGLTESEAYDLVGLLLGFNGSLETFIDEETNKIYEEGYEEGYRDARNTYERDF